jgi:hypothetical protein
MSLIAFVIMPTHSRLVCRRSNRRARQCGVRQRHGSPTPHLGIRGEKCKSLVLGHDLECWVRPRPPTRRGL